MSALPWTAATGRPAASALQRDLTIAAAALAALLAWDASGLDLASVALVGTPSGFAWREHVLTSTLLHDGGRRLALVLLALQCIGVWRPRAGGPTRRERALGLAATLVCLAAMPLLKRWSTTSCPWDLAQFGGTARYVSHWAFGVADGGPGHCFPSGHASAAFAFFSGYFVLRPYAPRRAARWLAAVLVLGAAYGAAQWLRGAHFPSHTLWTAWLCWLCSAVLAPRRVAPLRHHAEAAPQWRACQLRTREAGGEPAASIDPVPPRAAEPGGAQGGVGGLRRAVDAADDAARRARRRAVGDELHAGADRRARA